MINYTLKMLDVNRHDIQKHISADHRERTSNFVSPGCFARSSRTPPGVLCLQSGRDSLAAIIFRVAARDRDCVGLAGEGMELNGCPHLTQCVPVMDTGRAFRRERYYSSVGLATIARGGINAKRRMAPVGLSDESMSLSNCLGGFLLTQDSPIRLSDEKQRKRVK